MFGWLSRLWRTARTPTLYERIGGQPAMDLAVDIFYRKVLRDEHIRFFFEDVDMDRQRVKQKRFLTMVCGGPGWYGGKRLREAHRHLLAWGLNDGHFDRVIGHLGASLEECGVAAEDVAAVVAAAEGFRAEVLGR